MSLINQMLRDLEKRNNVAEPQAIAKPTWVTPAVPLVSKVPGLAWNVLAALSVWGLYVGYQNFNAKPEQVALTSSPAAMVPSPTLADQTSHTQAPVVIPNRALEPSTPGNLAIATSNPTLPALAGNVNPIADALAAATSQLPPTAVAIGTEQPKRPAMKLRHPKPVTGKLATDTEASSFAEDPAADPGITKYSKRSNQLADTLYRQALNSNNNYLMVPLLKRVISLNPRHLKARLLLAKTLHSQGQINNTAEFLDQSLAFFPTNLQFINTRAQIHLQQKNSRAALNILLRIDPGKQANEAYLSLLAASYQQLHAYSNAGKIYQHLVEINPKRAESWLGLAITADKSLDNRLAREAYQQALDRNTLKPSIVSYIKQRLTDL